MIPAARDPDQSPVEPEPGSALAPPGGGSVAGEIAPFALVVLAMVVALECVRVLFSVAYHTGESAGWVKTGLAVVGLFAVPVIGLPLRRLVPPGVALLMVVALAVAGRLALQLVGDVGFPLASGAAAAALLALSLAVVSLHGHARAGWLDGAVAVSLGAAVDVVIRATDATWDVVWRHDLIAWMLTLAVLGGLALVAGVSVRVGAVPARERAGSGLAVFVLWPYLYFLVFYAQSPAFVDSSAGVRLPTGLAVALGDAVLAVLVIGVAARRGSPAWVAVVAAAGLAVAGYALPVATGAAAVGLCVVAQVLAAALVGRVVGAEMGPMREYPTASVLAFAAGGALFAGAALLFTLHTIQPLPFSNRFVPAVVGAALVVAALATDRRSAPTHELLGGSVGLALASVIALAVVVPLAVALTWPDPPATGVADRPLRVMTFNIQQGVTLGQLDLDQISQVVKAADPDVVVMEEVGRGWSVSGMTDEAEWLQHHLRMAGAWGGAADHQFGNLVLSRAPIAERGVVALGPGDGTQARSAVFVSLDLGGGRTVRVIGTHLQNGSAPALHDTRADEYRSILTRWGGAAHTIFIGDLNTYPRQVPPGWPELNLVVDAGFRTTQDLDHCVMATSNANCPDWIFVSPDLQLSPVTIVVDRPDHRPITATVSGLG